MKFPAFHGLTAPVARELVRIAIERGRDPLPIAAVIESESGWNPKAGSTSPPWSTKRTASGLIQWIESTIRNQTGMTPPAGQYLTRDWLPTLSAVEQLPLVFDYYDRSGLRQPRPHDYYLAGWGRGVGKPDEFVLARAGDSTPYSPGSTQTYGSIYTQNSGLDLDKDGTVTVRDIRNRVQQAIAAAQARGMLDLGEGLDPMGPPPPPGAAPPPWTPYTPSTPGGQENDGLIAAVPLVLWGLKLLG